MFLRELPFVCANEVAVVDDFLSADVEAIDPMRACEDEPCDQIVGATELQAVGSPDGDVRPFPAESSPMSFRPSTAAPPRVPSRSASRVPSAFGPPRARATSSACLTSRKRSPRSFEAEPSTPSPTRTFASSRSRTRAMPAPSRMFDVGQCATPTSFAPNFATSSSDRCTQCAHHTSPASQPSSSRYSTGLQP